MTKRCATNFIRMIARTIFILFLATIHPARTKIDFQATLFPNADHIYYHPNEPLVPLYEVVSGNVEFFNQSEARRVRSAQMVQLEDVGDIFQQPNVQLVNSIISEKDWNDELFPKRTSSYTYMAFLQAVAMFPAFCGEYKAISDNLAT